MSWGYFQQGSDQMIEVEELGAKLSEVIHCPVHYPAYGKRMFECRCGVVFPVYFLRGNDWTVVAKRHETERYLAVGMLE